MTLSRGERCGLNRNDTDREVDELTGRKLVKADASYLKRPSFALEAEPDVSGHTESGTIKS